MLGALDELDGVAESRVSWDGRRFRLELRPGADRARVTAAAAGLLGGEPCCVTEPRGRAAAEGPERWFDEPGTVALSRHEAEGIAARWHAEIAAEVALDEAASERLHAVLREELQRAFERAHEAGGGVERLGAELPRGRGDFERRLGFLTDEQRAGVEQFLEGKLAYP